jgi:hypothetical protein
METCQTCKNLAPAIDRGWYVETQPSALKESSRQGCRSCKVLLQALESCAPNHFNKSDAIVRLIHANDSDGFMVKISPALDQVEEGIEIFNTNGK